MTDMKANNLPADLFIGVHGDIPAAPTREIAPKDKTTDEDAMATLEGKKAKDSPDDYWWRFSAPFRIEERSKIRFELMYRFGIKPPGCIWFDDFRLVKSEAGSGEVASVKVEKGPKMPLVELRSETE